tara:strand:+ start:783 stop:1043 length:261 start_codon:yes stop_codon:yes gene_type:complete
MTDIKQGEAVIFIEDYDLFDYNCNGSEGMYYKTTSYGKYLVYVPSVNEWAEPQISMVKRKRVGHVPKKYSELCKYISELRITLETV